MMNTARVYSGMAAAARQTSVSMDPSRPGSVKKQKQQRKAKDSIAAKQSELSVLVGKLEDRDTQQQAFTSLLELIPSLDSSLVSDLYSRIEKNKNPGRSSTRRMFVLVLAAVCKCHPVATSRLLPRIMAYIAIRLRDKETQVTEACVILCSAIALYVVPYATVNSKGCLSPRKKQPSKPQDDDPDDAQADKTHAQADPACKTFETLVAGLSKETNAVGEHATKCIAALVRPVEFDGTTSPSPEAMKSHGQQILPYLRVVFASLVVKMNESTQYASFSSTFVLLQSILGLAKVLKLDCEEAAVYEMVMPQLGSLLDSIEDVFRDGPRDDWLLRKRSIEVLIQLIDLFVLGATAIQHNPGWKFFEANVERVRRLVMEARHDPVSAVRDAALPAVFQFDALLKLFPRTEETAAPPSPFKRVYTARGNSSGSFGKSFTADRSQIRQQQPPMKAEADADAKGEDNLDGGVVDEKERDEDFGDMNGDEAATPHGDPEENEVEAKPVLVPTLKLKLVPPVIESDVPPKVAINEVSRKHKETRNRQPVAVQRVASPKPRRPKRDVIPFQPLAEDEVAFTEEQGDEFGGHSELDDQADPPSSTAHEEERPSLVKMAGEKNEHKHSAQTKREKKARDSNVQEHGYEEAPPVEMSRAEAAVVAAEEGEVDLALRLSFLEDDATLLKKVLVMAGDPRMSSLSRATRTALCAAFLEFLEPSEDEVDYSGNHVDDDVWLAFVWLKDLSSSRRLVQQLDPRVLRGLELRLNHLAEMPNKTGLVASDILTKMGL